MKWSDKDTVISLVVLLVFVVSFILMKLGFLDDTTTIVILCILSMVSWEIIGIGPIN